RFLEHSRIYYFRNGGDEQIYLGSADLMPRNLNRRIEVLYPVLCSDLVRRLRDEILGFYLEDNVSARLLRENGDYRWWPRGQAESGLDSQGRFLALHSAGPARLPRHQCR